MCGILFTYNIEQEKVEEMIRKLSLRGRDGVGVYIHNFNESGIGKSLSNPKTFEKFELENVKLCLANSRAIPTTEVESGAGSDISNQQPFEDDRYVLVFNGIISNDKELIKEYDLHPVAKVDTAILPLLFSKLGVVEGMKKLKGSFAILCWDKFDEKLYAGKNFMPLQYYMEGKKICFISLKEMCGLETKEMEPYCCYEINTLTFQITKHSLYPKERNKKVLCICSSGIDSTTTAYLYKHLGYEVTLLHFNYGQAAEKVEDFAVRNIAKDLGCELIVYNAKDIFSHFKKVSILLQQKKADKSKQMLDAESTLSYVPNRNAIFAMIGAGIAEMRGCNTLTYGGQQMDSVYPDNNPTFTSAIDTSLKYSLNWGVNIKFTAPLIHLIKHEIVSLGKKLGVKYELCCSCYYPSIKDNKVVHCGECGCCSFRNTSFKMCEEKDYVGEKEEFINKYVLAYT